MNPFPKFLLCLGLFGTAALLRGADTPAAPAAAPTPVAPAVKIAGPLKTDKLQLSPSEDETGFRRAVRVGNTLYISGSTAGGEMPDAIRKSYGNLQKILAHYGLGFQHVVKETVYTTQFDALKANTAVRRKFYGKEFPSSTWVQVARLWDPAYVIEVELTAVFPE